MSTPPASCTFSHAPTARIAASRSPAQAQKAVKSSVEDLEQGGEQDDGRNQRAEHGVGVPASASRRRASLATSHADRALLVRSRSRTPQETVRGVLGRLDARFLDLRPAARRRTCRSAAVSRDEHELAAPRKRVDRSPRPRPPARNDLRRGFPSRAPDSCSPRESRHGTSLESRRQSACSRRQDRVQ